MNKLLATTAALALGAGAATAGGLDRSGQGVGILWETGDVAQLSFSTVQPTVEGTETGAFLGGDSSGNIAESYSSITLAFKKEINEQVSLAMIFDQPFGADVAYDSGTGYYAAGSEADVNSTALTALLKYQVNDRISVYGGVRRQTVDAYVSKPPAAAYEIDSEKSSAFGYVVGAAYEIPEIAFRVALTYNSKITHDIEATETCAAPFPECGADSETEVTTPESINLDFQSGVAEDTLVFGSIRHAKWTQFDFAPPAHVALTGNSLQDYDNDVTSYSLGVGRRLNDQWSAALSIGYEAAEGGFSGDLAPTDGNRSIGIGATYTGDGFKVTSGIRYIILGDATTEHPAIADSDGAEFEDNTAIGFGIQLTTTF